MRQTGPAYAVLISITMIVWTARTPAHAESSSPVLSVDFEEDWFVGTDRYYTTGIRIALTWPDVDQASLIGAEQALLRAVSPLHIAKFGGSETTLGVGTQYYTPDNASASGLGPGERPFAGWLYLDAIEQDQRKDSYEQLIGEDFIELQIGVVGPHAYSRELQTWFHQRIWPGNSPVFVGWPNQIKDELGLMLLVDRSWKHRLNNENNILGVDIWPQLGGAIGNVRTELHGGVQVRAGYNLPDKLPLGPLKAAVVQAKPVTWSFYGVAGFEERAVLRNIFLDGNTFVNSASVPKRILVTDAYLGVVAQYGRYSLSYQWIDRSKEFFGQVSPQKYGVIALTTALPF